MTRERTRLIEMDAEMHVCKTMTWKPSFRIWKGTRYEQHEW